MNSHQNLSDLIQERDNQLAMFAGIETQAMLNEFSIIHDIIASMDKPNHCTITVFKLNAGRISTHCSMHNDVLSRPSLNTAIIDNINMINQVTCPDHLPFCLDTEIKILNLLQQLNFCDYPHFKAIYSRPLLEKDDKYVSYIHHVTILKYDEQKKIWLLKIVTERMPGFIFPAFRLIQPAIDFYVEEHSYSNYLLNFELPKQQARIVSLLLQNKTQKFISDKLEISPSTVKTQYQKIEEKLKLTTIQEVTQLARIFDFIKQTPPKVSDRRPKA
jgi:DNA-binding CsgD family transcriptional regulator